MKNYSKNKSSTDSTTFRNIIRCCRIQLSLSNVFDGNQNLFTNCNIQDHSKSFNRVPNRVNIAEFNNVERVV